MNKGFTLAELMAVIVIIGIIAVITTVTVDRSIKNSRYDTCLAQEKNIKEGAEAWSYDNASKLPETKVTEYELVTLSDLQEGNYVEDGLKSPMTNKEYSTGTTVVVTTTNPDSDGKYKDHLYLVKYGDENEKCSK